MNCKNTSLRCALLILFLFAQNAGYSQETPWLPDSVIEVNPQFSNPASDSSGSYVVHQQLHPHQGTDKDEKRLLKDSLNRLKRELYQGMGNAYKNDPDSIEVTRNFNANPVQNFTPMDNAMAISPDGIIVSAVNANWCVFDKNGSLQLFRTFKQLANDPSLTSQFFDPRVVYDPVSERFIMVILHGILSTDSRILVFVSKDKDPLLGWNVYSFSGNPFSEGVFSDYPHLGISANHVWVSLNLFGDQDMKFKKSLMLVLDKNAMAQGATVNAALYQDLKNVKDKFVFSLVPANNYDGFGSSGIHFISSADRGGEELYLFYLDPGKGVQSKATIKTGPYSLPPDAMQKNENTLMDGGDCRITGAFYRNGLIHFCLNTKTTNLRNAIYYGRVDVGTFVCEARTIASTKDMAYGSPVSFASFDANRAVLIPLVYASENDHPSIGYLYVDDNMKDYALVSVFTGLSPRINTKGEVNRWGDYTTAVSLTSSEKPEIWFTASGTSADNRWQNFLVQVIGDADTIRVSPEQTEIRIFPNPVRSLLKVEVKLESSSQVEIGLYDSQGKKIENIWTGVMSKGNNRVIFEPRVKASGLYYVRVMSGGKVVHTETLFIE
ncbi:MAG: T9SS type A sorting domain-containing protein [Bacteroidia bacterium]